MPRFFNRIRKQLAKENKFFQYSRYAIGEILLVVIGILIALQIDNWNESRKTVLKERNLLGELKSNLETNVKNLESDIDIQIKGASAIHFLLDHLDNQRSYIDTLDYLFEDADFVPNALLTSSAFETLKSSGLEIIRSDVLRNGIINLFEVRYPYLMQETASLEDLIWPTSSVALYQKYFRREISGKAHPIDYERLLDDKEFTNMLSFRLALRETSTQRKIEAVEETKKIIHLIDEQFE